MNVGRSADFTRDQSLETVLAEINGAISDTAPAPYQTPKLPVVFIVGAPRSGTTLMSQWLAASGLFAYPSNLIARFFGNPYFGARVQQALLTFDTNRQIFTENPSLAFSSDLGRTDGALAPSEFWYFWRRFFSFGDTNKLSADALSQIDTDGFLQGLAGLEAAQGLPLATKAMIVNWNLDFLDSILPHVLFVNVVRDPFYNAQSLLQARERFFDDRKRWYSFKPPEYENLKNRSPIEQVVGQIYYNRTGVRDGLARIEESRQLTVNYSEFCLEPEKTLNQIRSKFSAQGFDLDGVYSGPAEFRESRSIKLNAAEEAEMRKAISDYAFD